MIVKTEELTGSALGWAVAQAEAMPIYMYNEITEPNYETEEDAKRTYVASKFGDEVDIPDELVDEYKANVMHKGLKP